MNKGKEKKILSKPLKETDTNSIYTALINQHYKNMPIICLKAGYVIHAEIRKPALNILNIFESYTN